MMSSKDYSTVLFSGISSDAFFFQGPETGVFVEEDAFQKSEKREYQLQSSNNKYLVLDAEDGFLFKNLNREQQKGNKFDIQFYNDSSHIERKGKAAILYANIDDQTMVVCCSENHKIIPEAMDLPSIIVETAHKALFYMTKISPSSTKFKFESSMYQREFLGLELSVAVPSLNRLVLHYTDENVDEPTEFRLV
ncbi:interleukin-18-like [Aulostomus maculatus]